MTCDHCKLDKAVTLVGELILEHRGTRPKTTRHESIVCIPCWKRLGFAEAVHG